MPKFRKRPVVIEAFQWHGESVDGFERIAVGKDELSMECYNLRIPTLEGVMYASEGDYIITGVKGETYPCKPDIFAATYEPAETLTLPGPVREAPVEPDGE
jgi:hypothetical protein